MACSNQSAPGHFESTNDRGVRNDETVIPEDTKSELLPTAVLDESILIPVPMLSQGKGIL